MQIRARSGRRHVLVAADSVIRDSIVVDSIVGDCRWRLCCCRLCRCRLCHWRLCRCRIYRWRLCRWRLCCCRLCRCRLCHWRLCRYQSFCSLHGKVSLFSIQFYTNSRLFAFILICLLIFYVFFIKCWCFSALFQCLLIHDIYQSFCSLHGKVSSFSIQFYTNSKQFAFILIYLFIFSIIPREILISIL